MMTPQEHLEAARDYALKGCTAIEVNGITFHNLSEMLQYMDKQKNEIKSLKAQIEKLKCCENCKHHCFYGNELNCRILSYDEELECMKTKSRWEEIKDESN